VHLEAVLFQERNEVDGVLLKHTGSLAAALRTLNEGSPRSIRSYYPVAEGDGQRRRRPKQTSMWVATPDLPRSVAHPFYARLNQILDKATSTDTSRESVRDSTLTKSAVRAWRRVVISGGC
jgi:hypothetical protein